MKKENLLSRAEMKKVIGGYIPDTHKCLVQCGDQMVIHSSETPCDIFVFNTPNGTTDIEHKLIFSGGSFIDGCSHTVPVIHQA